MNDAQTWFAKTARHGEILGLGMALEEVRKRVWLFVTLRDMGSLRGGRSGTVHDGVPVIFIEEKLESFTPITPLTCPCCVTRNGTTPGTWISSSILSAYNNECGRLATTRSGSTHKLSSMTSHQ
ncbi:hypothetical protein ARMGADRAFT_1039514 [Armillaria gallica]|uniref:Uncharacterized protein n=1 Tax=Armillaria gallica TaxID=47427 RepID=A0A2H3CIR9_ARMGA|nr:hypothetical protein ARMGADRAFT_1039514 [Armillaria gallica]